MGFVKGRPLKNLLYAATHPLVAARERPILFLLGAGSGIYFLGVVMGWWPNILADFLSNLKK